MDLKELFLSLQNADLFDQENVEKSAQEFIAKINAHCELKVAEVRAEYEQAIVDLNTTIANQLEGLHVKDERIIGLEMGREYRELEAEDAAAQSRPVNPHKGYPLRGRVYHRKSTDEWVLELSGSIEDEGFICRHTQPLSLKASEVPGLPLVYLQLDAYAEVLAALKGSQKAILELREQGSPTAFWDDVCAANEAAISVAAQQPPQD